MVDEEDVAPPISFISAKVTDKPRPAASRAMPHPLIPPPITKISTFFIFDLLKNAKGITNKADLSKVEIIRKNSISQGGGKIKAEINLIALLTK